MAEMKLAGYAAVQLSPLKQQQLIDWYMVLRVLEGVKPHSSQSSQQPAVPRLECHPNCYKIVISVPEADDFRLLNVFYF